ncbi:hypothetical protein LJC36_05800 [Desulfovibrio sp. OttesenSCG-928-C14]|nr:hypothetical protein [Desulfovibrio sp. OttesenSCG-928-C14]
MFFLLSGSDKKPAKSQKSVENLDRVKELFNSGRFPVVTTATLDEGRKIGKVLGLVACRGFDSEDAFYGMAARAVNKGAQAIVGYQESVAFHPDGSKYFTCYGTAVQFEITPDKAERRQLAQAMHQSLSARA